MILKKNCEDKLKNVEMQIKKIKLENNKIKKEDFTAIEMNYNYLDKINFPSDLRKFKKNELNNIASELRKQNY